MKEVLFDFEEFKKRVTNSTHTPVHYSFRTSPSAKGMFSDIEFKIFALERENKILVFEIHNVFEAFDEGNIELFQNDCMKWARELGATPGYYEEDQPLLAHSQAKEMI